MRLVCEPCVCSGGSSTPPTPMCLFSSGTSLEHPASWPEPSPGAERVLFFSRTVGATTRVGGGSSRKEEPHGEEPSGWVSHGSCVRRVTVSYPFGWVRLADGNRSTHHGADTRVCAHGTPLHATSPPRTTNIPSNGRKPVRSTSLTGGATKHRGGGGDSVSGWGAWLRPRTSSAPARPIQA